VTICIEYRATGSAPDPVMSADMRKSRIQRVDAVRDPAQVRVQCNAHDFSRVLALAIKHIEGATDGVSELLGRAISMIELGAIIGFSCILDSDDLPAVIELKGDRLVVVTPIADVFDAGLCQYIQSIPRFASALA